MRSYSGYEKDERGSVERNPCIRVIFVIKFTKSQLPEEKLEQMERYIRNNSATLLKCVTTKK
jgi:hypothetical protein